MAIRVTKDDFNEKVLLNKLPVVVDFYSDSCVACKKLAPVLGGLEDDYEGKLEVVKVNTNFDLELAEKYNVTANPTILLINNGEEIDRRVGAASPKELYAWIDQNINNEEK